MIVISAGDDLLRRQVAPDTCRTAWPVDAVTVGHDTLRQAAGVEAELEANRVTVVSLPPELDDHCLTTATWNLVTLLMRPVPQYDTGELVYPVEVRPGEAGASHYSASSAAGGLHTDGSLLPQPPHIAVLMCLSEAEEGGETVFVRAEAVRRYLAGSMPELLPVLYEAHPFATDDDTREPRHRAPIFREIDGMVRARYLRKYVEAGWRLMEERAPRRLTEVLDAVDSFVARDGERLAHPLRRGQIVLWRNEEFLHGRNAFTESANRRRRLVRFYGQLDGARPVHAVRAGGIVGTDRGI